MTSLKTELEIEKMASAGAWVARAFERVEELVGPGTTTQAIDDAVRELIEGAGGELIFYRYRGFPAHTCISVNEEVVHGIPGARVLREGDIVTVDVGVRFDGFCGDSARTYFVGEPSEDARGVVETCRAALSAGIEAAQPFRPLREVSRAIQSTIEAAGRGVVKKYVGHGIGREMHEDPQVPNFVTEETEGSSTILEPGMVIAIEPMVTQGPPEVRTLEDGWTVVTADGGLAAHCEHTVAITDTGPRVLTVESREAGTSTTGVLASREEGPEGA